MSIDLKVDQQNVSVDVDAAKPLLWVLREDLGMQQTKFGCGAGLCGACTVYVGDRTVRSCTFPISRVGTAEVRTVAGIKDPLSQALKEAWLKHDVAQCGYCQPALLVSAHQLLSKHIGKPEAELEISFKEISNICRCGTYVRVRAAMLDVLRSSLAETR